MSLGEGEGGPGGADNCEQRGRLVYTGAKRGERLVVAYLHSHDLMLAAADVTSVTCSRS